MTTADAIQLLQAIATTAGEAGPFVGQLVTLGKKAFDDHGEEGGRAHLAALLELEVQAAVRAKWGA